MVRVVDLYSTSRKRKSREEEKRVKEKGQIIDKYKDRRQIEEDSGKREKEEEEEKEKGTCVDIAMYK
ncbi:hypothetical protein E2C01_056759 [Portunus trituberculatus]|uniref:Uncharacterized protein n=1 Tax=Portunus trituberculatus TaxID=210409 RepID=A0A5B7GRP6_PORTR|nr:hypothetical protein [Portunus trituberculatus]